jgi:hypothetical protein
MGALLSAFKRPGGPKLFTGSHSGGGPEPVTAVIQPAKYATNQVGGASPAENNSLCPQAIISGIRYNITFERQLPDSTPSGLLIPGATAGTTTVRWGTTVTLMVDMFSTAGNEFYLGCVNGTTQNNNYVAIVSMRAAN